MKTVQQIFDIAQDYIKIDSDTIGIPGLEEARTITWINDLHRRFFDEIYSRGVMLPRYMRKEYGFDAVTGTTLDGAITAASTKIDLTDASNFDSSGAIVIREGNQFDIVFYTGKSSNQITGVTEIGYGHADDENVYKLYALPSNFGKLRPERNMGDGVMVQGVPYYESPNNPKTQEFTVIDDGNGSHYLWLPDGATGDVQVLYDAAPTTLTATTDTIDIPPSFDYYIIWGLIGMWKEIQDEDYLSERESIRMDKLVNSQLQTEMAGKNLRAGVRYFGRRKKYV